MIVVIRPLAQYKRSEKLHVQIFLRFYDIIFFYLEIIYSNI